MNALQMMIITSLLLSAISAIITDPNECSTKSNFITSWFTANSLNTNVWRDISGNGNDGSIAEMTDLGIYYGGDITHELYLNNVPVVYGSSLTRVHFAPSVTADHTVFNLCKYRELSDNKQRIIQSEFVNTMFGHHSQNSGVGYEGYWISSNTDKFGTDWLLSAQTKLLYRGNGRDLTSYTGSGHTSELGRLMINDGRVSVQPSDWSCAEIIIVNDEELDLDEIKCIEQYFSDKYNLKLHHDKCQLFAYSDGGAISTYGPYHDGPSCIETARVYDGPHCISFTLRSLDDSYMCIAVGITWIPWTSSKDTGRSWFIWTDPGTVRSWDICDYDHLMSRVCIMAYKNSCYVELYEHDNFEGSKVSLDVGAWDSRTLNLSSFSNIASSMIVSGTGDCQVYLFEDDCYHKLTAIIGEGQWTRSDLKEKGFKDNVLSSVIVNDKNLEFSEVTELKSASNCPHEYGTAASSITDLSYRFNDLEVVLLNAIDDAVTDLNDRLNDLEVVSGPAKAKADAQFMDNNSIDTGYFVQYKDIIIIALLMNMVLMISIMICCIYSKKKKYDKYQHVHPYIYSEDEETAAAFT